MFVYYMYSFDCQQSIFVNEVDCILMSAKPVTITGSYVQQIGGMQDYYCLRGQHVHCT